MVTFKMRYITCNLVKLRPPTLKAENLTTYLKNKNAFMGIVSATIVAFLMGGASIVQLTYG